MQPGERIRMHLRQTHSQRLGAQRMVPEPTAVGIHSLEEQVRPLQVIQDPARIVPAADRVAQRGRKPLQNGGVHQEALDVLRLLPEHFVRQVIRDVAVPAAELAQESGNVRRASRPLQHRLDRRGRELYPGRPALGAFFQKGEIFRGEAEVEGSGKKGEGFLVRELQILRPDLGKPAAGAPPVERPGRIHPGENHHREVPGQVI
jgi:hypothetical protein